MISKSNYFDYVEQHNLLQTYPQFKEFHEFTDEATQGGTDWSAYEDEPETRQLIDGYFDKVNSLLKSKPATSNVQKEQPRKVVSPSPAKPRKEKPVKREPKARSSNVRKKVTRKSSPPKTKKQKQKKAGKVLNLPKGKLVELVDPHLLFIGRYLRMNNQVRSRNAVEKFFAQINQAADARLLRKASPYSGHIVYIQKQLIKHLQSGDAEITIDIPPAKFNELLRAVAKEQQMTSVRLLKRYHNMAGRPIELEKAKKFYNELYNAIEKGKIPEKDRLFKRVATVMRDLQQYVKNEDVGANLLRLPVELGSVLGFMDGCLCSKDRELKYAEKPDDVNVRF